MHFLPRLVFFYFKAFNSKIDIFIFEAQNEGFATVFAMLWQNYPLIFIAIISAFCGVLFYFAVRFVPKFSPRLPLLVVLTLANLLILFYCIRGGFGTFPLREDDLKVTNNKTLDDKAANPILALSWAHKHQKKAGKFV